MLGFRVTSPSKRTKVVQIHPPPLSGKLGTILEFRELGFESLITFQNQVILATGLADDPKNRFNNAL